jgi:hypothetical protein
MVAIEAPRGRIGKATSEKMLPVTGGRAPWGREKGVARSHGNADNSEPMAALSSG